MIWVPSLALALYIVTVSIDFVLLEMLLSYLIPNMAKLVKITLSYSLNRLTRVSKSFFVNLMQIIVSKAILKTSSGDNFILFFITLTTLSNNSLLLVCLPSSVMPVVRLSSSSPNYDNPFSLNLSHNRRSSTIFTSNSSF